MKTLTRLFTLLAIIMAMGFALVTPAPASAQQDCKDGELLYVEASERGLPRLPVVDGARWVVVEMARNGSGFGNLDRNIWVFPPAGEVWQTNFVAQGKTVAIWAFCDYGGPVGDWAVTAHVPNLIQASRAPDGSQPHIDEIGVYRLDAYETGEVTVLKSAPSGTTAEMAMTWLDVSFNDGTNHGPVALKLSGTAVTPVPSDPDDTAAPPPPDPALAELQRQIADLQAQNQSLVNQARGDGLPPLWWLWWCVLPLLLLLLVLALIGRYRSESPVGRRVNQVVRIGPEEEE